MTLTYDFLTVTCGIPQGSILGALLFLIYINNLSSSSNILTFYLFVDDTNIYVNEKILLNLKIQLTQNLVMSNCGWMQIAQARAYLKHVRKKDLLEIGQTLQLIVYLRYYNVLIFFFNLMFHDSIPVNISIDYDKVYLQYN